MQEVEVEISGKARPVSKPMLSQFKVILIKKSQVKNVLILIFISFL